MGSPRCQLKQLRVLVTRPEHQAAPLLEALRAHGAEPLAFPTIEITAAPDAAVSLKDAGHYDDLIFVSANAATFSLDHFTPGKQRVIAIGAATRKALDARGVTVNLSPREQADSEHLLEHPDMQQMQGRRVLIIRGDSGRELLAQSLLERGAKVDYAEVYWRRIPSDADCSMLRQKWPQKVDVITATSNIIINNLLELCGNQESILKTPIVVISKRCSTHAHACGFQKVIESRGASVEAIITALCEYYPD
ncbi:uroporphyrinogen-III synthase [Solemya elarraichensis gill symbiont]|uniref:Uroporphyrinogen-III synthase n=1 Tax=Solemya elarraichensis gill symbiont TaxID=1918949 RepID=A0A1T2LAX8_9GAMM|nr:uroporphyrinogen-III synthase [Solemya elarraichensis gill symbiont]OOZ42255.1 hypothetical protein BOW52_03525 [Solemya elarraichensis gill symbiont]